MRWRGTVTGFLLGLLAVWPAVAQVPYPGGGGGGGGGGGSGTVSSGLINQLGYYAGAGTTISGLATGNNGVLVTNGSGVPSISSTLPSGLAVTNMVLTTPTLGVATGTSLGLAAGSGSSPALTLAGDAAGWYRNSSNQWTWVSAANTANISLISGLIRLQSSENIAWTPADSTASADTTLCRLSAGTLEINSGSGCGVGGALETGGFIATVAAPTVAAAQIGFGSTTAAASNCGTLAGGAGCIVINVAGTTRYLPYY